MKAIQLIGVTPEELKNSIVEGLNERLQKLEKNFQPKEPETYLTRKQVCELLHVEKSTLSNWAKNGRLKPIGIGGRVLYKRSDIDAALIQL